MVFSELMIKLLSFVVLMLVGYVGARRGVLSEAFARGLSRLVMDVFLTCSILNSVIASPPAISGGQLWQIMLLLSFVIVAAYLVAIAALRLLRHNDENGPVTELLVSVMNNVFIGMPLVESLYGATAVLYCALSCIPFNIMLYTYGVWRLKSAKKLSGGGMRVKDVLTMPLIATFVALGIFILRVPMPRFLTELIGTTAAATMPTSMIVIGATLGRVSLTDAFREKRVYLISFLRLIVVPALVWLVLRLFVQDAVLLSTCVILSACPSAVVVTVMALQYDYDASYSSKGVLVTTVLSMITLPVFALLLG